MRLCSGCRVQPCTQNHNYCYACARIARGQPPIPKFRRDVTNKTMCSKCKVNPRLSYHRYCQTCKNTSTTDWAKRNGGHWAVKDKQGKKRAVARKLVFNRVHRGKMERKPCEVCGNPKVEAHHHKGYDGQNAYDVRWLCLQHHRESEKKLLDARPV